MQGNTSARFCRILLTTRSTFKSDTIIEIALEDGGNFTVQRALLCNASEYFRAALQGQFAESQTKKLRLPGCDTRSFELLLYWICNKQLPGSLSRRHSLKWDDENYDESERATEHLQGSLARLWYTAGMYLMPALQNKVMDCLLDIFGHLKVRASALEIAFDAGSPDCLLRSMLLQEFVDAWKRFPSPFLRPSMTAKLAKIPGFFATFADMAHPKSDPPLRGSAIRNTDLRQHYYV